MVATRPPVISAQGQVLSNLRREAIGGHSVADLHSPESFLRRVADRIIRGSFQDNFRVVVADGSGANRLVENRQTGRKPGVRVVDAGHREVPWREGKPERRGFRAQAGESMELPEALGPAWRAAAEVVAKSLAVDGLLETLARVIGVTGEMGLSERLRGLDEIGFPVDLLAWFDEGGDGAATLSRVQEAVRSAGSDAGARRALRSMPFLPRQSLAGFAALDESGAEPIQAARLQMSADGYWAGSGDGSCLDLAGAFAKAVPTAKCFASVERRHLAGLLAGAWDGGRDASWIVFPQDAPVSQWAQDNAKAGRCADGEGALLVPRYPSRGEVGATFVPGELECVDRLTLAGVRTARSPLLFQGGNIIVTAVNGERVLLVGEAEIWRNTALGLNAQEVERALAIEFGAARVVVLPAASFHIDFEVSARATPRGPVAFVNDSAAGARIVLACALEAAERAGLMPRAGDALAALRFGKDRDAIRVFGEMLARASIGAGRVPESLARHFSLGPADHGASNLHRAVLALDALSSMLGGTVDGATKEYYGALQREEADRRILRRKLVDAGFRVVPVPGLPDAHRGINALNGLHEPGRYLMPAYGGIFEPMDQMAAAAIVSELGPGFEIVRLNCAETQRRSGAIRCAIAPMAKPGL